MATQTLPLDDKLYQYMLAHLPEPHPALQKLHEASGKRDGHHKQIAPEQGHFIAFILELIKARKTLDIGTFRGYSALVAALTLPDDGKVITCDTDTFSTDIALQHWEQAGVSNKIQLKLAPARETLQQLIEAGEQNTFDFVFIDADKPNYQHYFELSLQLLRPNGLLLFDNMFWSGQVTDTSIDDDNTHALRTLAQILYKDKRISLTYIPLGDGMALARKRG